MNKTTNKTTNKATNNKTIHGWRDIKEKKVNIYAHTFDDDVSYSTSTYRKTNEGYINAYIPVDFPNNIPDIDEGKFDIIVENGFLSAYEDKNGLGRIKMVVMDWRHADES